MRQLHNVLDIFRCRLRQPAHGDSCLCMGETLPKTTTPDGTHTVTGSPRVWDIPTIPHDVNQIVDCNGVVWSRAEFGFWETFNTNGGLEGCFDEIGLLGTYGPLTEQETEHDS